MGNEYGSYAVMIMQTALENELESLSNLLVKLESKNKNEVNAIQIESTQKDIQEVALALVKVQDME